MIEYHQDSQKTIPTSEIKVIGLGGAGSNMIDRIAMEGLKGAGITAINADIRTLNSSIAKEKIQLGKSVTRGLGCGGDPALGLKVAQESEAEIRDAIKGHKIIFICVGLGGGTGSGAASLITRIAREENAFTVVFATMPFSFEGIRRRAQADAALNELAVIANALVTFDNGRMTELVLASKGIHEAFIAADTLISDSIQSISRVALFPGLIHIGLDDLVSALSSNRSRCLFGSGKAVGEDRIYKALDAALSSPLLDKGSLLKNANKVLIHLCGGASLTLFETEVLMKELKKHLNPEAQIFFGVSIDESMEKEFSVTLISSLPEEDVVLEPEVVSKNTVPVSVSSTKPVVPLLSVEAVPVSEKKEEPQLATPTLDQEIAITDEPEEEETTLELEEPETTQTVETLADDAIDEPLGTESSQLDLGDEKKDLVNDLDTDDSIEVIEPEVQEPEAVENEEIIAESDNTVEEIEITLPEPAQELPEPKLNNTESVDIEIEPIEEQNPATVPVTPLKRRFAHLFKKQDEVISKMPDKPDESPSFAKKKALTPTAPKEIKPTEVLTDVDEPKPEPIAISEFKREPAPPTEQETTLSDAPSKLTEPISIQSLSMTPKKNKRSRTPSLFDQSGFQGELELGGKPKGRFEGESPNIVDGEDLDIPTYLRDEL